MNTLLLFLSFFILLFIIMVSKIRKLSAQLRNRAHFYVARDKNGELWLYMGKPIRTDTGFHGYQSRGSIALTYYLF